MNEYACLKINLLNLSLADLTEFFVSLGEKSFRAQQVFKWIHKMGADDFNQMTDLSLALREHLKTIATIQAPEIAEEKISQDGTVKWLLQLEDNNFIETVFIPENDRGTLCVSSQVGCILNCSFCSTGKQGFNRNLELFEIIGQVYLAVKRLQILKKTNSEGEPAKVTNVVMMGMGEPLLNYEAVIQALKIMRHDNAYALPRRRVTVSTAGLVPKIDALTVESDVSLAISLHAPNDELRNVLVPLNKKYPIRELIASCKRYVGADTRKHVTIEYVMLKGINDSIKHAKELIKVLQGLSCKVNLIPFNPHPGTVYERSEPTMIDQFRNLLIRSGFITTVRKTRGDDIDAACGQLAGNIIDRTSRSKRWKKIQVTLRENETWMEKSA